MENLNYVHNIIAPKSSVFIMPAVIMILFVVMFIGCIGIMYYMRNTTINVNNEYLTIKSFLYGKTISLDKIDIAGLRRLNLYDEPEYNIRIRTNGVGLPNYFVGWMKLNNGNRALVYLTDRTNVALIPTDEYSILFSTDDFEGLKEILNKRK